MPEPDPDLPVPQNVDIEFHPKRRYLYQCLVLTSLANGKDMAIDGSVTPVDFSFAPIAGAVVHIEGIRILMIAPGGLPMDHNNFGNRVSLINGFELGISLRGKEENMCRLKDNAEIALAFTSNTELGVSGASGMQTGFLNTPSFFLGEYAYKNPLRLDGDENERLFFRVRDDLTDLETLQATFILSTPM